MIIQESTLYFVHALAAVTLLLPALCCALVWGVSMAAREDTAVNEWGRVPIKLIYGH